MTANKGDIMSNTTMQEAAARLAAAATEAANVARQFNADLEAMQRRLYMQHLERRRHWDQVRAQKRAEAVDVASR